MAINLNARLRLENDQVGNTWFSTAAHDGASELQLHMSHETYLTIGSPDEIIVTVEKVR